MSPMMVGRGEAVGSKIPVEEDSEGITWGTSDGTFGKTVVR
jgi:hypothetical protein